MVGSYECSRFYYQHIFMSISIICAIGNCVQKLIRNFGISETTTFKLYNHLIVTPKAANYFTRHTLLYTLLVYQIILVSMWLLLLKCWSLLPSFMTVAFAVAGCSWRFGKIFIRPFAMEKSHASKTFMEQNRTENHTFNRKKENISIF